MKILIIILTSFFIQINNNIPEVNKEIAVTDSSIYVKKKKKNRDAYYCIIIGTLIYIALGLENKKDKHK
tara:strand:- start:3094 stop:3300 length:207 start_codon:yes stop_codon:yes gene_type:complete